jgi:transcriptional regulator with PAS, ATPase and Fis domain
VSRIGSAKEIQVDVRIIAATHKDLKLDVERGVFREDLYYRLNALEVKIPSLRERPEDIPELTRHLVQKIAYRFKKQVDIGSDFMAKMKMHAWPGNIREMENAIEGALVRSGISGKLSADQLEFPLESGDLSTDSDTAKVLEMPDSENTSLRDAEKLLIHRTILSSHGNIRKAAETLGIGRNTLYRKMKEYGICPRVKEYDLMEF